MFLWKNIVNTLQKLSAAHDEKEIVKYENELNCSIIAPVFYLGAIINLVYRFFLTNDFLSDIIIDSAVMTLMSMPFIFKFWKIQRQRLKAYLMMGILSLSLIFFVLRFYIYIGPAVWSLCIVSLLLSIIRIRKNMLVINAITVFSLGCVIWYLNIEYVMGQDYYVAQMIIFAFLYIVAYGIQRINYNRHLTIIKQYKDILNTRDKLFSTINSVGDGVISVNCKGLIEYMNPVAEEMTGWLLKDARRKSLEEIYQVVEENTDEKFNDITDKIITYKINERYEYDTELIPKNGKILPISSTISPIIGIDGEMKGAVIVFKDTSIKKAQLKEIEILSYRDHLTGLYNRRFFEKELHNLDKKENLPISFIYADINGLKTINDAFGHSYGDLMIKEVSDSLTRICNDNCLIARTGGDEFVLMLLNTSESRAREIKNIVDGDISKKQIKNVEITVSLGHQTKYLNHQSTVEILKQAEENMYQQKMIDITSKRGIAIKSILHTLMVKCPRENAHSKRVSQLCEKMGEAYGLDKRKVKELQVAGELHDIGKITLDGLILNKVDPLSDLERSKILEHPQAGYRLLGTSVEYIGIAEYVLSHHERWDGTGYPHKLKGNQIPWEARVICVADAYDAMTSIRPYRKPLSKEQAIQELLDNKGTQFDPHIVDVFISKVLKEEIEEINALMMRGEALNRRIMKIG